MQDGTTRDMILDIPEQVAHSIRIFTLAPGDCIPTGISEGFGRPRGIFLQQGKRVGPKLESIGRLEFHIVKEN